MPAFLLPLLWRVGAAILFALVIAACWWKVNHWCNAVCQQQKVDISKMANDIAERDASIALTQKRATELALLWSRQVDKSENAAHSLEVSRNETFAKLLDEARRAGLAQGWHDSVTELELYKRAYVAASSTPARPPGEPPEAAPTPAGSPAELIVALYAWAGECKARVDSWAQFYRGLQAASGSIQ